MGQRFQAFLIAKVVPHGGTKAYYRCVVAWHHQWCDGLLPTRATARFIQLLKNKDNSEIVRHELAAIQGKYGRSGQQPRMINAPCGYLAFLLAQAWNFDLEDNYISGTSFLNSLLPADMGSMDGDNNDGIAVIDVTDPSHPRYSLADFQKPGLVAEPTGLSPYYFEDEWEDVEEDVTSDAVEKVQVAEVERKLRPKPKFVEILSQELVVTPEMYAEAWPQEYAMPKETSEPIVEESESQARVPPLAELTTGPAVDAAIAAGDTTGIEDLVWMPEKMALIKVALEKHVPFPDVGIPLLLQIFKTEFPATHSLNLSRFALGTDQIATILKDFVDIDSLTLPANPTVDINTVRAVLTAVPQLRCLVLFDTGVSPDDLALLIAREPNLFYFIEDLVHPYIYKHGPKKGGKYFSAFSYAALKEASNGSGLRLVQGAPLGRLDLPGPSAGGASVTSLPLLHPAHVVQGLTDILSTYVVTVPEHDQLFSGIIAGTASEDFLPQVALASGIRAEGQAWGDRRVSSFPKMCDNSLRGEGWTFAIKLFVQATGYMQMFSMLGLGGGGGGGGSSESYYGFVKVEKSGEHLSCDLAQFLQKLEEEGRPKPTPEAVQRLEKVLSDLKAQKSLRLITQAEVASIARV